jgi:hydroxymethylpyrimidine pyrophosphatase-like HAD family hydrolase
MANAETPEVTAAADVTTLSNVEEGVAVQLEEMLAAKAQAATAQK